MKEPHKPFVITRVKFVLLRENQRKLLRILTRYSPLKLIDISKLLDIPYGELIAVMEKKHFLSDENAKKLVKYFCIFCGC